uniref:Cathepsin L-like cysteine proteinase n=1 Tax=Acanthoscelides obtectus TaxID=200917 RepID=Q6VAM5_ACAOB|nr:cathepsin L-like cysteine proteinase precursor [Acanthoscelides obtectus]
MKGLAIVAVLIIAANGLSEQEKWQQFKIQHGRTYRTLLEEKRRFEIFKFNLRTIEEHNERYHNGEETFEMGINQFGDMTQEEFKRMLALQKPQMPLPRGDEVSFDNVNDIPKTVDWREKGAVTEVKKQGNCGSCWAFSAVGSIEGQVFLKNGSLESLSAQNLVDCAGIEYGNFGCERRIDGLCIQLHPPAWNTFRCGSIPTGDSLEGVRNRVEVKITGYQAVSKGDEVVLAQAVATIGPISIALDGNHIMFYRRGIVSKWCGCKNSEKDLNHGVLLVGYGDGYWIVKNSWGRIWGEQGYFRLKKDAGNTCGVATWPSYPIL